MAEHGFTFWMEKKSFFIKKEKKKKEVFKYDKGMEEEKKYYATWHEDNFL